MRIAILVEGGTEKAFLPQLREFLKTRVENMPKLDPVPSDSLLPRGKKLARRVELLLSDRKSPADLVVALTDVYTGEKIFNDAQHAIQILTKEAHQSDKFIVHAAQYEFEAWLVPYWSRIQQLSGSNRAKPRKLPENINHQSPPSHLLKDVFRTGRRGSYIKRRDAGRILANQDLTVAANECPQLKAFLNTLIIACKGTPIP